MSEWGFASKGEPREIAIDTQTVVKRGLVFPGSELRDIELGMQRGTFVPKSTYLFCIEKDRKIAKKISQRLSSYRFNFDMHCGEADGITQHDWYNRVGDKKFDFGFLDFCNQITHPVMEWLHHDCSSIFARGADVSFTFSLPVWTKTNRFMQAFDAERLYHCIDLDNADIQLRDSISVNPAYQATVAAVWAALSVNYRINMTHIRGYYGKGAFAMVMIKTKIIETVGCLKTEHLLGALQAAWAGKTLVQNRPSLKLRMPQWEIIGCHPAMSDEKKAFFVSAAKKGQRPPWMNPQTWAWNSMNKNGIRLAA